MKLKININGGKLRRFTLFNIPIFEYGIENNKNYWKFLLFKSNIKPEDEIFYLKQNKVNGYSLKFLQQWIDIIPDTSKIFIIVDDNKYLKKIVDTVKFKNRNVFFIKSIRNHYICSLLNRLNIDKSWINAACAHLTTFYHSQKHNIKTFWNIDADDTLICLNPDKAYFCLRQVSDYAIKNNIDAFSLDFYYSRGAGKFNHWSFGVSHIINNVKISKMLDFGKSDWYKHYLGIEPKNLDWYMNYLKDFMPNYKVMSYCINNLLFLHDTEFFTAGWLSFMQYKNEVIEYPIFKKFYELDDIGLAYIPLHKDVIKFDLNIEEKEGLDFLFDNFVNKNIYNTFKTSRTL